MRRAPSPPSSPLLGHARAFQRAPLPFMLHTARQFGPVARLRLGPLTYHLVSGAPEVEQVLAEKADNYRRDTRSSRTIRLLTGESLLTSEGENWRRQRRLAQPIFHQRRLAELASVMCAVARQTAAAWERNLCPFDLAAEMSRLAFRVVGRCLFGAELDGCAGPIERSMPVLLGELFRRTSSALSFPLWLPTARHRAFRDALRDVDQVVTALISGQRGNASERTDLLSLLLAARDEDGAPLADAELRNHTLTFLLAGHETTASTLTWTLSLLDEHPHVRSALEMELDAVLAGATPTLDALPRLPLLDAVLRESLRLYPSIWISERTVVANDVIGGYSIPAGSTVVVSAYASQRLDAYWDTPDSFRPERFQGRPSLPGLREGYFPFGAGPHLCIGQHFAVMEAKLLLATLLQRFRIRKLDHAFPALLGGITLRPRDPVLVRLELR